MVEIPIDAVVECTDGRAGKSSHIILNPIQKTITHLVVSSNEVVGAENWMVPVEKILETGHDAIHLNCSLEELRQMLAFSEMHWVQADRDEPGYAADAIYLTPYVTPLWTDGVPIEFEQLPASELAIRRGAFVEASDGLLGTIGEFLVDPESKQLSHIVLQEGHVWGKREIAILLSAVDEALESTVYLKLSR